nr:MAG TPA: SEPTUM SITE-DETERMINING PROTEIN DIVIVA CELL DIVISION, SEPTATION, CELL.4A [Caudoviricetes sp.]
MDEERKAEKINAIPLTRSEVGSTVELIGKDIKALREENKQLRKSLTDAKSRVILLEENYITLLEDITQSNRIDIVIYIIFAVCIILLGFTVYGLTH